MAYKPTDWSGSIIGPNSTYPYGAGLDGSTYVNFRMLNDILMLGQKMMDEAGVTPNSSPDNDDLGYQLFESLLKTIANGAPDDAAGAWIDAGTPNVVPLSGTVTVTGGDTIYNRYKVIGKTLFWQLQLRTVTISGSPIGIEIDLPTPLIAKTFVNEDMRFICMYNITAPLYVSLGGSTNHRLFLSLGGGNFTNGTNDQQFDIYVVAELV